ncbi:sugar phosphate isomerase/epimerase family protein [Aureibacillus halotolerans]|uniref:Sugar phosphate isomerase/epimerase n=1 Tax=Aureibacillus halotolerans TaxID=1508390 RepID=A0A4R6U901_9BACI|nr:sugar phosphate isomerase/epimerase [Aureibacillus halotolerans]TDQ41443.1 sugar phosphate isomerase/epimerase [Aureibacillus halotolerans]
MKFGVSSYSVSRAISSGHFDIFGAMEWIKEKGAEHIEIVPIGFDVNVQVARDIRKKGQDIGLEISNYAIGGQVLTDDGQVSTAEVERLKREVDIAEALGVKRMRHDVASHRDDRLTINHFDRDLSALADACREVAQYAKGAEITTSVENHGFYVQGAERVSRLIAAVNETNFALTLDVGNYLCVDEEPEASVMKTLELASMVHFKDFLIRRGERTPGGHWIQTPYGSYLRGTVIGDGGVDLSAIARRVAASYDGYVSVEFEGPEECLWAAELSLNNVKALFADLAKNQTA